MENKVVGINKRNIGLVYPNNPRKFFRMANDKALAKNIMEANGVPTPKTYMIIEDMRKLDDQLDALNELESFVVKPSQGSGGGGILILFKGLYPNSWRTAGGDSITREELEYHLASIIYGVYTHDSSDKAIIEFCLTPHPFFKKIYSSGIPDLRIIVHKGKAEMGMLRVPTEASDGKANLHQGAMGIGVNMEGGFLTEGFYKNEFVSIHPDTGFEFVGEPIPQWKECLAIAEETSKYFPLNYLGVDIIYDEKLGPLVIEINARPGLQIQNVNKRSLNHLLD